MYQSVSSVRIYESAFEAEDDSLDGFITDDDSDTPWLEIQKMARTTGKFPFAYEQGFEQGTFEGRPYHEITKSVWGRILVLNEIRINEEYRTTPIINSIFRTLLNSLKKLGIDWVIVNTNVNEDYMKEKQYLFHSQFQYNTFLTEQGFEHSRGRLHNNEVCFCYQLQKEKP